MPVTLLIIDDDEDDRELFVEAVEELDPEVKCVTAKGGEDALKMLKNGKVKPDFIFLDLNMPRMSGKECLAKIKAIKEMQKIPVVIYSTSKLDRDVAEVKKIGAVAFLTKPSRQKDLMNSIRMVLDLDFDHVESC